jgi:hypothetical protein
MKERFAGINYTRDVLTNLGLREDSDKELCQTEQAVVDARKRAAVDRFRAQTVPPQLLWQP